MEFSDPKIKNFLVFSQKKDFLIFREMKLSSPKLKKLLIFQEIELSNRKLKKNSYILGGNFKVRRSKKCLTFSIMILRNKK